MSAEASTLMQLCTENVYNDNGVYCHRIVTGAQQTATFPASEWNFYRLEYVKMF